MSTHTDEHSLDDASPNPLVKTIACGSVRFSIFQNEGQRHGVPTVYYTVKASRSYRDKDGNQRYTNSFYKSHLPQLIYACQRALQFIEDAESEPPF